jgi:hypothetical protein
MDTNTKAKPKSCGCRSCKLGRPHAGMFIKLSERSARHANKAALRANADPLNAVIAPAHRSGYTD